MDGWDCLPSQAKGAREGCKLCPAGVGNITAGPNAARRARERNLPPRGACRNPAHAAQLPNREGLLQALGPTPGPGATPSCSPLPALCPPLPSRRGIPCSTGAAIRGGLAASALQRLHFAFKPQAGLGRGPAKEGIETQTGAPGLRVPVPRLSLTVPRTPPPPPCLGRCPWAHWVTVGCPHGDFMTVGLWLRPRPSSVDSTCLGPLRLRPTPVGLSEPASPPCPWSNGRVDASSPGRTQSPLS